MNGTTMIHSILRMKGEVSQEIRDEYSLRVIMEAYENQVQDKNG